MISDQPPNYTSLFGKLLRKWDWWIYCRAFHSLRRMTLDNPGMAYLMELQMRDWNKKLAITPELRRATEIFHESMVEHCGSDEAKTELSAVPTVR